MAAVALRARQPHRHRRPQPAAAGRRDRAHDRASSRSPNAGAPSAGRVVEVDGHDIAALIRTFDALPLEAGRPTCVIAQHAQGPRRVVHRGPGRVAPPRADRRRAGGGAGRARRRQPMTPATDCRIAFAETLVALAEADPRIVAVVNDSVGSSNLKEFKRAVSRPAGQRRHRRAEPGRRQRRPGERRQDPVRVRRVLLPDRPRARADQGRPRLQPPQREAVRHVERHGLRRARADAPLDRGPGLDARDRQPDGRRAGRPGRDRAGRARRRRDRRPGLPPRQPHAGAGRARRRLRVRRSAARRRCATARTSRSSPPASWCRRALDAAALLEADGISAAVLNMSTIRPHRPRQRSSTAAQTRPDRHGRGAHGLRRPRERGGRGRRRRRTRCGCASSASRACSRRPGRRSSCSSTSASTPEGIRDAARVAGARR